MGVEPPNCAVPVEYLLVGPNVGNESFAILRQTI
jgi:hypothetical protein